MERVVEDSGATRQSRRERILTTKALEQEKMKRGGKVADGNRFATLSQRPSEARNWEESDECDTDNVIEVMAETPDAPRPDRTRRRPRTPTRAAARGNTKTRKEEGDVLSTILSVIEELRSSNEEIKTSNEELKAELAEIKAQLAETKAQLAEMVSSANYGLRSGPSTGQSPQQSYASVLTRSINPSSSASQPVASTASNTTNTLYCTIDTSGVGEEERSTAQPGAIRKAIEEEIRTMDGHMNWSCAAVIRDARNMERIRIACRDEAELQRVKEAAQRTVAAGARVLRDQLYPVKVDNANRTAILDQEGKVLPGAAEVLGKENDVHIAKIGWLSRKDSGKAYGSMVVYVTKGSDAARLLQDQYFHVAGESAYTRVFEPRYGPQKCYRCQEIGHKAYSCTQPQACAKCAQVGHHHSECQAVIPKCATCGGPHESFSRNCRTRHSSSDV
jgi:hypothetical protein